MKTNIIKLWMSALILLLSVPTFATEYDYDPNHFDYSKWRPGIKDPMDPYYWFYTGLELYLYARDGLLYEDDEFYSSWWNEHDQCYYNRIWLLYISPQYVDSVVKKTNGILCLPDTIHYGSPDQLRAAWVMKDVEGIMVPNLTDGHKVGNVFYVSVLCVPGKHYTTACDRLLLDTQFAGVVKYIKFPNLDFSDDQPDSMWTGCYRKLPVTSIDIMEGTTSIGSYSFLDCKNLSVVNFPKTVKRIGVSAFEGCTQLESMILPDSVIQINKNAFNRCRQLKKIVLPDSLRYIDDGAFHGCTQLKDIILPERLYAIGEYAFSGCNSLESITIPERVKYTNEGFLANCANLKTVIMKSKTPSCISYSSEINKELGVEISPTAVIYVPKGCAETYRNDKSWKKMKDRIFDIGDPAGQAYLDGLKTVRPELQKQTVYDLQGRPTNADCIRRGNIYIVNGKKVMK